jgi:nitrite reductase/ring-hydroxylating ferredoxin subunit/uncharacterized membrane protein
MTTGVVRDMTRLVDALTPEQNQMLDQWSDQLQELVRTAFTQGGPAGQRVKDWLNGVWLGHPLHPALTDAAIGAWSAGAILDLVGAQREADAAMTVGVLSAIPTAVAGAADWVDTSEEPRRIGLVHALLNSVGLTLMIGSLFARRSNNRALAIGLSTTGLTFATVSAWLGGELVYRLGTNVSREAFEPGVDEYQEVARAESLEDGKLAGAELEVDGQRVPLALLKRGRSVMAISATCTHWGGPLAEGKLLDGDRVECPWHASQFDMHDGTVQQGPATAPVHVFEARLRDGRVEVRRRPS